MEGIQVSNDKKPLLAQDEEIQKVIRTAEEALGDSGRVLVRASGTEPLIRVMLEGSDERQIGDYCRSISEVIRERLG